MNRETFSSRVLEKERTMYCIARTMLSTHDCEEAVQSAILRAWENLPHLRSEEAFDPWLLRILRNECLGIIRRRKREALFDQPQYGTVDADEPTELYDALHALSAQERLLLLLHHDEGYTLAEIAHICKVPESVIKMRLYRARKHLRTLLEERL